MFWIVSLLVAAFAGAWFHHLLSPPSAEERAHEQVEKIKEKIRGLTH